MTDKTSKPSPTRSTAARRRASSGASAGEARPTVAQRGSAALKALAGKAADQVETIKKAAPAASLGIVLKSLTFPRRATPPVESQPAESASPTPTSSRGAAWVQAPSRSEASPRRSAQQPNSDSSRSERLRQRRAVESEPAPSGRGAALGSTPPLRSEAPAQRAPASLRSAPRAASPQREAPSRRQAPPTTMRGGLQNMAVPRKGAAARRRYDIAVAPGLMPGVEVRLPSLPRFENPAGLRLLSSPNLLWRIVSAGLVGLLGFVLYTMLYTPAFQVADLEVVGLTRISQADIETVVRVRGLSIFEINPQALHTDLQAAFPELTGVSVQVNLPAGVRLTATERQPVVVWVTDDGEAWSDADGVVFSPRGSTQAADGAIRIHTDALPLLPQAAGLAPTAFRPGATLGMAGGQISPDLIAVVRSAQQALPPGTALVYNSERGLGWTDAERGWDVYFGRQVMAGGADANSLMVQKLLVYQALLQRLAADGLQPGFVSVEFLNAPYFRLDGDD